MENPDPLLSQRECAVFLSISKPTFWRRVGDGTLPKPIKIGGMSRWRLSDIEKAIERAERESRDAA
ncbi:MAG: DNA-binding protein [Pseudomonadota bacterium]